MGLALYLMVILFVSAVVILLAFQAARLDDEINDTTNIFVLVAELMSGYGKRLTILMTRLRLARLTLRTRWTRFLRRWNFRRRLLPARSSISLLLLLLSGLLFVLFFQGIFASAAEISASSITAVPTNGGNSFISCAHGSNSFLTDIGTRKIAHIRSASCTVGVYAGGVKAGQTFAVSVLQLYSGSSFGAKYSEPEAYPSASFITYDEASRTMYFKALQNNPTVGSTFKLDNDADYLISAYVFTEDNLDAIRGYCNSLNEFIKIIANQQVAINSTISDANATLAHKLDGVVTWISAQVDYDKADRAKILAELKKLNDSESKREEKEKEEQSNADNNKKNFEGDKSGKQATDKLDNLSSTLSSLFFASPTPPKIAGEYNGVKLNFDLNSLPSPPAWLITLEGIPLAYISIRCSARLIKTFPELITAWREQTMSLSLVFDFLGV